MLTFICERYFEGREDQIKEYTIAVEALGRRTDFDPHVDTIVRVTAHSLRKRLQEVYQHEGADRPVHVVIPAGNYVPSFVPHTVIKLAASAELALPAELELGSVGDQTPVVLPPPSARQRFMHSWMLPASLFLLVLVLSGAFLWAKPHFSRETDAAGQSVAAILASGPPNTVRALLGADRKPYVDRSGVTWLPSTSCDSGSSVNVPQQKVVGTEDPYLYLGGLRGIVHCTFPVKPGFYELHLHFAEMSDLPAATHASTISVNAGPMIGFDVVDDAGGDGIATAFVTAGVRPENDGLIHLDFVSETSLLNAVEILPAPSEALLPVRIVASSVPFKDAANQVWLSDRYYSGGRRGQLPKTGNVADLGMYGSDRIGQFRYNIPVLPGEKYRVKLFFREPWFSKQNGVNGGPGSRVFDVSCNGILLLKDFDILQESGADPIVKTFENIQATTHGKIELSFTPVTNYPLVNAIEIVPEPQQ
jgi:hypothetical protein